MVADLGAGHAPAKGMAAPGWHFTSFLVGVLGVSFTLSMSFPRLAWHALGPVETVWNSKLPSSWLIFVTVRAVTVVMQMAAPEVCWPKFVVVPKAPSRLPYDLEAKVWAYETVLHWKLKDVLDVALHSGLRLSRFVKRDLRDFQIVHQGLFPEEAAIIESWKAAAANDRSSSSDSHQEFAVSTLSLCLMLVWFAHHRHQLAERSRSEEVLRTVFRYLLPGALCEEVLHLGIPDSVLSEDACSQIDEQGLCRCCGGVLATLASPVSEQVPAAQLLVDSLLELSGGQHHLCRQSVAFLGFLLLEAVRRLEASFVPSDWNQDALKTSQAGAVEGRQARVDHDLKAAAVAAVAAGRAHNTQALMKAIGYEKDAKQWEKSELVNWWYASSKLLTKPSTLVLAVDPARFGNPGEEVVVTQAQHISAGLSLWMPPMVRRAATQLCTAAAPRE